MVLGPGHGAGHLLLVLGSHSSTSACVGMVGLMWKAGSHSNKLPSIYLSLLFV